MWVMSKVQVSSLLIGGELCGFAAFVRNSMTTHVTACHVSCIRLTDMHVCNAALIVQIYISHGENVLLKEKHKGSYAAVYWINNIITNKQPTCKSMNSNSVQTPCSQCTITSYLTHIQFCLNDTYSLRHHYRTAYYVGVSMLRI